MVNGGEEGYSRVGMVCALNQSNDMLLSCTTSRVQSQDKSTMYKCDKRVELLCAGVWVDATVMHSAAH